MAKITIFGLAGTGTSSVTKELALRLNFQSLSSGDVFRAKARELGLTLNEFEVLAKTDTKYDIELDTMIEKYGKENDNFIVESRLPWYFIPDSIKLKLQCDFKERVKRVAGRDMMDFEKAKQETEEREAIAAERYRKLYGIENMSADEHFELVLDTTNTSVPLIVETILA